MSGGSSANQTMRSSLEGDSNDDNGKMPHKAQQILGAADETEDFQPPPLNPKNNYAPRATTRRGRNALSFSITSLRRSADSNSQSSSNTLGSSLALHRVSSAGDVNNDLETGGGRSAPLCAADHAHGVATPNPTSPTTRRSIFRGGGIISRRSSDEHSQHGSERSGDSDQNNNNSNNNSSQPQQHVRKRSTIANFRLPPIFSPPLSSTHQHLEDNEYGFYSTVHTAGGGGDSNNRGTSAITTNTIRQRLTTFRRFAVNDYVLITNHNIHNEQQRLNLVNRYGYPEWGAGATTAEERRGPYIYLIAQVVSVHFGEDAQYYTVRREDNNDEQRADAQYMEPITNESGVEAAKIAALKYKDDLDATTSGVAGSYAHLGKNDGLVYWLRPCTSTIFSAMEHTGDFCKRICRKMKKQTDHCLNGNRPYGISCRFTGVNFFILCHIWYLYIDQLRLAFMPHSVDGACAVVSA